MRDKNLVRGEAVKKYLDKYSLGVVETGNSLQSYNSFYKNMGFPEPIEKLIESRLNDKVFVRVMDIGCGNGGFLFDLKKMFGDGVHTIGLDLLAPENAPDQVVVGDALEAEFPKDVDFIFSFRSLHEIGEPEKIVKKAFGSLAAGGKAFLSFRTLDLYALGKGIGKIGAKETKALQRMVRSRKLEGFSVNGFEARVGDGDGKKATAGVNVFLEK